MAVHGRSDDSPAAGGATRVLAVLRFLAEHPDGSRLGDVASAMSQPKSSVHRALGQLTSSGYARQDTQGRYHVGFELMRMVFSYHESYAPRLTMGPVLQQLADTTGETTHYGVLIDGDIVYQAKVAPSRGAFQMTSVVGGSNPAYRTGIGKALLMHELTDLAAVKQYVAEYGPLQARTEFTITKPSQLHKVLTEGRENGYILDLEENELGVVCIAFPLFLDSPSRPTGAISVSAVAGRTSADALVAQLPELRKIITAELGADVLVPASAT